MMGNISGNISRNINRNMKNNVYENKKNYDVRTDLALESRESIKSDDKEIEGVILKKYKHSNIRKTVLEITTDEAQHVMKKSKGRYVTFEINKAEILEQDSKSRKDLIKMIAKELAKMAKEKDKGPILAVGLGNKELTSDALGPRVAGELRVNRHLIDDGGICAIVPGVMAKSGMESQEIVKAIVEEIGAGIVIAIDSLAARSVKRLCNTIQISNTGIMPGSGVGNYRNGLTKEDIGIPVIAIGVPMVVDAATIVVDTIDAFVKTVSLETQNKPAKDFFKEICKYNGEEKYELIKKLLESQIGELFVTPKDVDEDVALMADIISEAINMATNGHNLSTY